MNTLISTIIKIIPLLLEDFINILIEGANNIANHTCSIGFEGDLVVLRHF